MKDPIRWDDPGMPPRTAWNLADKWRGDELTDMAGMTEGEKEEFLLTYGSRKERKAIKARRKAREQAQKQSN